MIFQQAAWFCISTTSFDCFAGTAPTEMGRLTAAVCISRVQIARQISLGIWHQLIAVFLCTERVPFPASTGAMSPAVRLCRAGQVGCGGLFTRAE